MNMRHSSDQEHSSERETNMSNQNEKKKQSEVDTHTLVSPPSHPTSLGNVWAGTTEPSTSALLEVLAMRCGNSDKTRDH